jgi:hypothetical protein
MNDEMTNRDQTDEEILTYTVSDDALEAAAGTEAIIVTYYPFMNSCPSCDCGHG